MTVLVGDIGGTKTRLAVAEADRDTVRVALERDYPSQNYASLGDVVERYLADTGALCTAGSFAVAGPVVGDCVRTTNLPWEIEAAALRDRLGFERVRLLNDLEAVAWGIPALTEGNLAVLQAGTGARGNACVVAAGTGLGEAGLYWDGSAHRAFATEGGHTDFAPETPLEFELMLHLKARFGRVSWERVVSGMGIGNLYEFLAIKRGTQPPDEVAEAIAGDTDLAAAVAAAASAGTCPVCVETMELFARLYGREAGNMALKHMALGGVFLGGGIAPKNLALLQARGFLEGFLDKGRMRELMEQMPVSVILEPDTPLLGAARFLASTGA